ncbi:MAG TPA: hypothetical protein VIM12_05780 [Noviherbaspirillum sp.]|jgi:DhnA family fructose-bisphosphate aldolase class Ia|uniref:hypothetical protein n=1 Tax=Noviherbaspirillum sp. TaxID=1926288 RepID=UPI002F925CE2
MSELLRIDDVKKDAEFAADVGLDVVANPYPRNQDPRRHDAWLQFYHERIAATSGAHANSHVSHSFACW